MVMDLNQETALRPVTLPSGQTFLESPRTDRISAQLKELIVEEYGKTGNLDAVCRQYSIAPRVFRICMNTDKELMAAIMEARERISDKAEGHIVEHMSRASNVVDRLAWLRAWRPAIWNPQPNGAINVNVNISERLASAGQQYVDTTATPTDKPTP